MEILGEYDRFKDKEFNALNDRRIHATHKIAINADTHMLFTWDLDSEMWVYTPTKMYAHTNMELTNMELMVRIRTPEKKNFEPQTTPKNLTDAEFAEQILSAIEKMKKQPEPACAEILKAELKKQRRD